MHFMLKIARLRYPGTRDAILAAIDLDRSKAVPDDLRLLMSGF